MLKLICWMTLFVDIVLVVCSLFTGAFGDGLPYARMKVGAFQVTSTMPGGAAFIVFVSAWTGLLAGSLLYSMRKQVLRGGL